jgi:hypothetical protein
MIGRDGLVAGADTGGEVLRVGFERERWRARAWARVVGCVEVGFDFA